MKRIWIIAGLTVAVGALAATVALADTTTPVPGSGYGRRIQSAAPAQGRGPMWNAPAEVQQAPAPGAMIGRGPAGGPAGRGAMAGRGAGMMGGRAGVGRGAMGQGMIDGTFCVGADAYDPAAMLVRHEAMIAQQEARVTAIQAQVDAATDEAVKARLASMLERMQVSLGAARAKLPVIQALPADYLEGMIALAKSDVAYFSSASSADAAIQAWIDQRLAVAQARLDYFEAEATK